MDSGSSPERQTFIELTRSALNLCNLCNLCNLWAVFALALIQFNALNFQVFDEFRF